MAHLLLHFGGVALRAGDAADLVFRQTHDAHKLCPTLDARIFIGGHGTAPDQVANNRDFAAAFASRVKNWLLGPPGRVKAEDQYGQGRRNPGYSR